MHLTDPMRRGFTLVEVLFAMVVLTIALLMGIGGWLFFVRGERRNSVQDTLDTNVRISIESLKADLRLSSMDKIFFSPAGPGPYTAVSFPRAVDSDGDGLIELDSGGKIVWDYTVIYHVWTSSPNELRRTIYYNRDNGLTDDQRQAQLDAVVAAGNGTPTYGSEANGQTEVIFKNLFDWKLQGKGNLIDCYNPTLQTAPSISLGSVILGSGAHTFTFTAQDKNAASSGYKIGLDTLTVTPCAAAREAEAQTVSAQSGATATASYMSIGSWSGNYQLTFPASAVGQGFTLTLNNDRWEETNFRGEGALCDGTVVKFDTSLTPKDFVVQLEGYGYAWQASEQTLDLSGTRTSDGRLAGTAVRVPIRGGQLPDGGAISFNGSLSYVLFYSGANPLRIMAAYIAESAGTSNYTPNAASAGTPLLFDNAHNGLYTSTLWDGSANDYCWAKTTASYAIDKNKNYVISFLVSSNTAHADSTLWYEYHTNNVPGCYILPGTNAPTAADCQAADWASRGAVITNVLIGVGGVYTLYPTNGTFTSQIFDTHLDAPAYDTLSWHATKPSGADVRLRVRSAASNDMSDATAWTNLTAMSSPGSINPGAKRYVQFQAQLLPGSGCWTSPQLLDVSIGWAGATKVVDLVADLTEGPDYGIFDLNVDGRPLVKGMTIDLTIYQDLLSADGRSSNRLTSTMSAEVQPRNTGK